MEDLERIIDRRNADERSTESAPGPWVSQEQGPDAPAPMAYVGVAIIVLQCFLRPLEWFSTIQGLHVGNLLGLVSLFVIGWFVFGEHRAQLSLELKLLLLLAGQMCLAVPFAIWRGGAFDTVLHGITIIALMAVAVGLGANSTKRLKGLIRIEALSISILTALTLMSGHYDSEGRLVGMGVTFKNANDLAAILAVSIPFCLMFLFLTSSLLAKLFWACSAAAMVYAVQGTLSRGGLISMAVGVLFCLWNLAFKERRRGALPLLALIVVSVLVMVSSSGSFRERLAGIGGDASDTTGLTTSASNSSQARQQLLRRAVAVMLHHPLFGVGPGNFYPFSGEHYEDWHVSHNTYTQCGAESGIPALLIFILMLGTALKHCKHIQKRPELSLEIRVLAIGLRASLLAYAVAAFFADTAYQFFPYFLIATSAALWQLNAKPPVAWKRSFDSQSLELGELPTLERARS